MPSFAEQLVAIFVSLAAFALGSVRADVEPEDTGFVSGLQRVCAEEDVVECLVCLRT